MGSRFPPRRACLRFGLAEGRAALAAAAGAQAELADAAGAAFDTPAFADAAAATLLRDGDRLLVASARDGARIVGLMTLVVRREAGARVARLLGHPYRQYDGALAAADAPDAPRVLLEGLRDAGVDVLVLRRVREDDPSAPFLAAAERSADEEAPSVDLSGFPDLPAYVARLPPGLRQDIRRGRRKLAAEGAVAFAVHAGRAAVPHVSKALELKRGWLASRGFVSAALRDVDAEAFLARATETDPSRVVVSVLSAGERAAAIEIGFLAGRRYLSFLGALDPVFASASPGTVQMAETIGWCIARGLDAYDLLAPADAYKTRWANGSRRVADHGLAFTWRGRLWLDLWQTGLRPRLKSLYVSTPPALRRALARA
jgi:CelD/BcsL family acetyltransferase involved in cellulose biosynthesis